MTIQHSKFLVQYSIFALTVGLTCLNARGDGFSTIDDDKTLTVRHGENTVLKYNIAVVPSPDECKPYYARSGHIHPVYTPKGHAVTGDMCPDHVHQHAIWLAWTNAEFEGRKIDFWNSQAQQGRVEHVEVIGAEHSDEEARLQVRLRHLDTTGDEPKEVLSEVWDVRVRAVNDVYVIDLESKQTCAGKSALKLKKYHYGAMGHRAPMAWNDPAGGFLTSEGKTRDNGNHTRPDWVDSFGPVDKDKEVKTAGITVMQHPSNFRYPQPVRLHPKFSYFCFAPMVLGDFAIEPGEEYVSRFRYVVHDGPLNKDLTQKLWKDFADQHADETPAETPTVALDISADGAIQLDGKAVDEDSLPAALAGRLAEITRQGLDAKATTLVLSTDSNVAFVRVQRLIQISKDAGFENFKLQVNKTDEGKQR